jgi:hypothetical protein
MHVILHGIGFQGFVDCRTQFFPVQANIESNGFGTFEKPVEVSIKERRISGYDPEAFPNAIAQHKAAIENRYRGIGAWLEFAIDPNQDVLIARIVVKVVNTGAHSRLLWRL